MTTTAMSPPPSSSTTTTIPPPLTPSALTTLISSSSPTTPLSASTIQILHNLQHQHLWTSLRVHDLHLNLPHTTTTSSSSPSDPSPLYLISGIPPHRLYTHPDEQLYILERGLREDDIELERMFVLPTVQGQSWSLRKMAGVFDSLPEGEGGAGGADGGDTETETETDALREVDEGKAAKLREYYAYREKARETREWGGKRILLGMVDRQMGGDGTVVYYVVQDGAVKPRQN
ncbi:hypothetical protein BO70DRAFT_373457 [Aspergillus heteromorphus CBS 117.55]|uniref:tRNA-splicing endonuclease subunit Sen15 domain-containing protein n=1 Tax=Aspergillus heteromorphus CBS 117.55 TaxID=1448321 RepID=A0A317VG19_9EURO|nr:uncharacterized protein BO70DRAFT_373457 [Aspergillus heteromorphus CBS 117.55]PWY72389.1 hypothetical protein BO70DRAFT_373457 [Aspergillus heteromorphus CBS 117.55]